MSPNAVEYNDQSLAAAKDYVARTDSNMGGTELQAPLMGVLRRDIACKLQAANCKRTIFVLTDGQISDTQKVPNFIRRRGCYRGTVCYRTRV
jgi:hypothetical protein